MGSYSQWWREIFSLFLNSSCLVFSLESWTIWMGLVNVVSRRNFIWPKFSSISLLFSFLIGDNWQPCFVWNYGNQRLEEGGVIISELKRCGCLHSPPSPKKNFPSLERSQETGRLKKWFFNWFLPLLYASKHKNNLHASPLQGQDPRGSRYPSPRNPVSRASGSLGRISAALLSEHCPFGAPRLTWVRSSVNIPGPQEGSLGLRGMKARVETPAWGRGVSRWQMHVSRLQRRILHHLFLFSHC